MTFSVVLLENDKPTKVIGTIWANEESQASALAQEFCQSQQGRIAVRKTDEVREIPFKLDL